MLFASCESMEEINNDLDAQNTGYKNNIELELTSDDYEAIAAFALDKATTPADSAIAAFIEAHEHFNDTIKAADFVPPFLADMYPALSYQSSALVTYNYNGEMPEDFTMYTDALEYELLDEEYESIDSILNLFKYFTPNYPPEVYIPELLDKIVAIPENGDIVLVSYKYSQTNPTFNLEVDEVPIYTEKFTNEADGFGTFTAHNVSGDQVWEWASYGGGCGKMTGYVSSESARYPNEDWLVSPEYDLSTLENPALYFQQAVNYNDGAWDNVSVYISDDYDGVSSPASNGTWTKLTVPGIPFAESWNFVSSGKIDLVEYLGKKVHIGFKYLSDATTAGTWEIGEVTISALSIPIAGATTESYKNYYSYEDGIGWTKASNIYYVNNVDYDAMGGPGYKNSFSSSNKPTDYLPGLLSDKYALSGNETEVITVYNYYNNFNDDNASTIVLADKYTKTAGAWESSYNFVEPKTDQFLVTQANVWVFDPTIAFTMASEDYQMVVDYVKNEVDEKYIDSYGTAEAYTGAGSYYSNYDKRDGKWDAEVFGSWEEAATYSIGSILLPTKFPEAQTIVDGVDMFYLVTLETYDGSDGVNTLKFQVTKAGPNPEFTLVEDDFED